MRISEDEFEAAVGKALASIPARFRSALDNVALAMADEPEGHELEALEHCGGSELLGLYQGVPLPARSTGYRGVMPDVITIFKGPHERVCSMREQLVRQIRITVLHELGHYFGFDDDWLHAHGY